MKSKHFKTEQELLIWTNENILVPHPDGFFKGKTVLGQWASIISVIHDHTNGDWIIFYIEEK